MLLIIIIKGQLSDRLALFRRMLEMACNDEGRGDPIGVIKLWCSSPNSFFFLLEIILHRIYFNISRGEESTFYFNLNELSFSYDELMWYTLV